jgi:hypothetical protein
MNKPDELFVIHDSTSRTTVNVRDASEEQLEKAKLSAAESQGMLFDDIQKLLQKFQQAAMANAVFTYELDRRSKALIIVPRMIQ